MSQKFRFTAMPPEIKNRILTYSSTPTADLIRENIQEMYVSKFYQWIERIMSYGLRFVLGEEVQELENKWNSINVDERFTEEEINLLFNYFIAFIQDNKLKRYVADKKKSDFSRMMQQELTTHLEEVNKQYEDFYKAAYWQWAEDQHYANISEEIKNKWITAESAETEEALPRFTQEQINMMFTNFIQMIGFETIFTPPFGGYRLPTPVHAIDYITNNKRDDFSNKVSNFVIYPMDDESEGQEGGRRRYLSRKPKKARKTKKHHKKKRQTNRKYKRTKKY
jgi:hypothetical protein